MQKTHFAAILSTPDAEKFSRGGQKSDFSSAFLPPIPSSCLYCREFTQIDWLSEVFMGYDGLAGIPSRRRASRWGRVE